MSQKAGGASAQLTKLFRSGTILITCDHVVPQKLHLNPLQVQAAWDFVNVYTRL